MANPLAPILINGPGAYGLNTQEGAAILDPNWCTLADNGVIGESANLQARKGFEKWNPNGNGGAEDLTRVWEFITGSGVSKILAASGTTVYLFQGSTNSPTNAGGSTSVDNTWEFVNFNNKFLGFHDSTDPVVLNISGQFEDVTLSTGTFPKGNIVMTAAGRVWCVQAANPDVLKFSALLDETKWAPADGGGAISMSTVWEDGTDRIYGLAEFQNKLIVFGRRHILIFGGIESPDDATVFGLEDQISGIGVVNKRCIQNIGTDLIFLSDSGVRSLQRTILTTTHPLQDLSKHVRTDLVDDLITLGSNDGLVSFYNEFEGIVVFFDPQGPYGYCLNLKGSTPDGVYPITRWDSIPIVDAITTRQGDTIMVVDGTESPYVHIHSGYEDGPSTAYEFEYLSAWFLMNQTSEIIIPKDFVITYYTTGTPSITYKLGYDFSSTLYELTEGNVETGWNIKRAAAIGNGLYMRIGLAAQLADDSVRLRNLMVHLQQGSLY